MADQTSAESKPDNTPERAQVPTPYRSLLAALAVTLLFYFAHAALVPLQDAERYFVDYRLRNGRLTAPNTNLVYLSVDRVSYDGQFIPESLTNATPEDLYFIEILRGEFPWNREIFAAAVDKLAQLGASKILLNFTFATQKPEDPQFMQVLNQHATNVVIGAGFHVGRDTIALQYPSPTLIQPNASGEVSHDHRIGFVSNHADPDGVSRRALYDLSMNQLIRDNLDPTLAFPNDMIFESLSSRVLRSLGRESELPPPSAHPLLRFTGPKHSFETISLKSLFDPVERKANFERTGFFRDKIVIIGPGQAVLPESYRTPFGHSEMDGSELHLNYLNAALQGEYVAETSRAANGALILLAGAVLMVLSWFVRHALLRIAAAAVLAGIWLVVAFWFYNERNLMLGVVLTPMLLLVTGAMITGLCERPAQSPSHPPSSDPA